MHGRPEVVVAAAVADERQLPLQGGRGAPERLVVDELVHVEGHGAGREPGEDEQEGRGRPRATPGSSGREQATVAPRLTRAAKERKIPRSLARRSLP